MGDEKRALAPTALTQFIFFLVGKALKKWKLRIGRSVPRCFISLPKSSGRPGPGVSVGLSLPK